MCAPWLECGELPASCRVLHATHSMLRLRPRSLVSKAALITRGPPRGVLRALNPKPKKYVLPASHRGEGGSSACQPLAHLCLIASLPTFISSALAALQPLFPV